MLTGVYCVLYSGGLPQCADVTTHVGDTQRRRAARWLRDVTGHVDTHVRRQLLARRRIQLLARSFVHSLVHFNQTNCVYTVNRDAHNTDKIYNGRENKK